MQVLTVIMRGLWDKLNPGLFITLAMGGPRKNAMRVLTTVLTYALLLPPLAFAQSISAPPQASPQVPNAQPSKPGHASFF
jgi:hypothetical protein